MFKYLRVKNLKKETGFTIIELLVVIAIIVLFSSLVLANYRVGQDRYALLRSAYKLAQDIRKTQQWSLSTKKLPDLGIPAGYGIHFKTSWPNYYIIYADDGNKVYSGKDTVLETIYLEKGVKISNLSPASSLSINFSPPDPTTDISGGTLAQITLSLEKDPTKTKTIRVNKAGLIYID